MGQFEHGRSMPATRGARAPEVNFSPETLGVALAGVLPSRQRNTRVR